MSDDDIREMAEQIIEDIKQSALRDGYDFDPIDQINSTLMEQTRINEEVIRILTNTN